MVETDEVTTPLRVDDAEFNAKMDAWEKRLEKAERRAKDSRKSTAFLGGVVGGAAGFVAGSIASSGPVSSIASVFGNILVAALAPLLIGLIPVLRGLSDFLLSPGVQKLINAAGGGLEAAGGLVTAAVTNEGSAGRRIGGGALTGAAVGAVAGSVIPGVGTAAGAVAGAAVGAASEAGEIAGERLRDEGYTIQQIPGAPIPFAVPVRKSGLRGRGGFPDPSMQG